MSDPRPVVVLLHGVGLDHTLWDPLVPLLDPAFDVRRPDLPGHGAGPRAPAEVDLAGLADLTVPSVPSGAHLVGFSLGALISQQLARNRPDLVSSLVCVSSVCDRTDAEREAVLSRLAAARSDHPGSVEASLSRWFDGTGVDPDVVEQTRRVLLANDLEQYLACYRVFATGDAEVFPDLASIEVPCLAVTGSDDPGSTPEMTRRLADAVPGARAEIVAGGRHMLPVQQPHALAELINQHLQGRIHA